MFHKTSNNIQIAALKLDLIISNSISDSETYVMSLP